MEISIAVLLWFLVGNVAAADGWTSSLSVDAIDVYRLRAEPGYWVFVTPDVNCDARSGTDALMHWSNTSEEGRALAMSVLLTAMTTGERVRLKLESHEGFCTLERVKLIVKD